MVPRSSKRALLLLMALATTLAIGAAVLGGSLTRNLHARALAAATCNEIGFISADTTWDTTCVHIITGSVIVDAGVTLTIDPGVIVKFDNLKGIVVNGTLIAQGTSANPITFTSNEADPNNNLAAGDWTNILFTDSSEGATLDVNGNYVSGSIIQHAKVEFAGAGAALGSLQMETTSLTKDYFIDSTTVSTSTTRGIYVSGGRHLKVTNSVITNNHSNATPGAGGGIYVETESSEINNSTFDNNSTPNGGCPCNDGGGGIFIASGSTSITNNLITNNVSNIGGCCPGGGGILLQGIFKVVPSATISGNTITGNVANGGNGGGILARSTTSSITNNTITDNIGSSTGSFGGLGGGIYVFDASTISGNAINGNTAGFSGGGIFVQAGSTLTISGNDISNNSSGADGGGIRVDQQTTSTISDNTITLNTAANDGGGIHLRIHLGDPTINGNTIDMNSAANNGGGVLLSGGAGSLGSAAMFDNMITNNSSGVEQGGGGIYITDTSGGATINYNDIQINVSGPGGTTFNDITNARPFSSPDINAESNWWGTTDPTAIEGRIWHFIDDASLGIVDFSPTCSAAGCPERPELAVRPGLIMESLRSNAIVTTTISLSNLGSGDLSWTLQDLFPAWLSATPTSNIIPLRGSENVEVALNATGLAPDTYMHTIRIDSDDPDKVDVPVELVVIPSCTLQMALSLSGDTLNMNFVVGTLDTAVWTVWIAEQTGLTRVSFLRLRRTDPPVAQFLSEPGVGGMGTIGVLTTLSTPAGGVRCSDWQTINGP